MATANNVTFLLNEVNCLNGICLEIEKQNPFGSEFGAFRWIMVLLENGAKH